MGAPHCRARPPLFDTYGHTPLRSHSFSFASDQGFLHSGLYGAQWCNPLSESVSGCTISTAPMGMSYTGPCAPPHIFVAAGPNSDAWSYEQYAPSCQCMSAVHHPPMAWPLLDPSVSAPPTIHASDVSVHCSQAEPWVDANLDRVSQPSSKLDLQQVYPDMDLDWETKRLHHHCSSHSWCCHSTALPEPLVPSCRQHDTVSVFHYDGHERSVDQLSQDLTPSAHTPPALSRSFSSSVTAEMTPLHSPFADTVFAVQDEVDSSDADACPSPWCQIDDHIESSASTTARKRSAKVIPHKIHYASAEQGFGCDVEVILEGEAVQEIGLNPSKRARTARNTSKLFACSRLTGDGKACGAKFARNEHLKRHEKSHDTFRPYFCPLCPGTRFSRGDNACDHFKTHLKNTTRPRRKRYEWTILREQIKKAYSDREADRLIKNIERWLSGTEKKSKIKASVRARPTTFE